MKRNSMISVIIFKIMKTLGPNVSEFVIAASVRIQVNPQINEIRNGILAHYSVMSFMSAFRN